MWESTKLFFKGLLKRAYFWIPPIFLDPFDLYRVYIRPLLPREYQRDIIIPSEWALIAFMLMILFASIMTYHELRKSRLNELYTYLPKANKDRIFRIFYELIKDGRFEKDSCTER